MAHLLTFVRFEDEESEKDELLFCEPLLGQVTSNDIFAKFDHFMSTHDMQWEKWVRVFSDEAIVMTGKHGEGVAQIK
jgi:hypothetical protein